MGHFVKRSSPKVETAFFFPFTFFLLSLIVNSMAEPTHPSYNNDPFTSYTPGARGPSEVRRSYADAPPPDAFTIDDVEDNPFGEHQQQTTTSYPPPQYEQDPTYYQEDPSQFENEPEQAPPPRRQFKYSTANMPKQSNTRKYCMILLLFIFAVAFFVGLSMLLQHLFFSGGDSDQSAPEYPERPPNSTFPLEKSQVDSACSEGTLAQDDGENCLEACTPQFFECCDPFDEFSEYNMTRVNDILGTTQAPRQSEFNGTCSFGEDLRGCMSYAKCQALTEIVPAAPAILPAVCSLEGIARDPQTCEDLCQPVEFCYRRENNEMAEYFDICMDYAPCQNLREGPILETAPLDLDLMCYQQLPQCFEHCEKARCCTDKKSKCFQENFMSCLTYAACEDATDIVIQVAPMFSVLDPPPGEIIYACDDGDLPVLELTEKTCEEYCEPASCCYRASSLTNCFHDDPLGCTAWHQQCQRLFQ